MYGTKEFAETVRYIKKKQSRNNQLFLEYIGRGAFCCRLKY